MSHLGTTDYKLEVMRGNVSGVTIMSAMGEFESGNVDADGEDVCRWEDFSPSGPPRLPIPAAAGEQMTVISENNNDRTGQNGVLTVRIHYLDATGAEQTEDITMNGTTGVNTTATNIMFVNDMYALTVGSNGVSRGNIAIYKMGDTIPNTLYNMIAKGGNKSLVPHRMVPLAKTLYVMEWHAEEAQGKRSVFRIRSTDMYGTIISGVFCFKDTVYMKQASSGALPLHATPVPALSMVKVSHWDDQAAAEGSCGWWGYLVND